ncbi:MAG: plasmid stabilization system protein ParE [Neolewinella sp.]|jgi:plasmid stabilization system protein ParE
MVGKIFRVVFSGFARRRVRQIHNFEEEVNGRKRADAVQREILKQATELDKLPGANPPYLDAEDKDIHYRKAFSYKIIFRVLKKAGEVFILTIRNDAEDTGKIKDEL